MEKYIMDAAMVRPSVRQIEWQKMEFYAFIHFGVNTFTNREWGLGTESPSIFNPTAFNADQWTRICKSAGMTGLILTAKHHDGFCLWPTKWTEHSIKNSPWKNGAGDIVREVSEACHRNGLKFGIYLSPWDRHEKSYGDYIEYNKFFLNQLEELLTQYGPVFSVWFDGACGESEGGKKQTYDWDAYYQTIRRLQPDAVITICGPDVRWCGNEAGHCRESEWSVVPEALLAVEKIQEKSQKIDDGEFSKIIASGDEDLGSREIIKNAGKLVWYPCEVDVSIRPGWFYHPEEDGKVKSLEELFDLYCSVVGGNACLLLNIPPDRRGLINEVDEGRLRELGKVLETVFGHNLIMDACITASETLDESHDAKYLQDSNDSSFWRPPDQTEIADITVCFEKEQHFDTIVLMEHIASGQRVESFTIEYLMAGKWKEVFTGTVIGYKKICRFEPIHTASVKIRIKLSRWYPTLSHIGIFYSARQV